MGTDGASQSNPVWFAWDREYLRFSQTTERKKYRNILRDPQTAPSIVDPGTPYRYLELRGVVVWIDPDPDLAFVDVVTRKYLGTGHDLARNPTHEERVVIVVEPKRVTRMG